MVLLFFLVRLCALFKWTVQDSMVPLNKQGKEEGVLPKEAASKEVVDGTLSAWS